MSDFVNHNWDNVNQKTKYIRRDEFGNLSGLI